MDELTKSLFMSYHADKSRLKYHFDNVYEPVLNLVKVDLYQIGELIVTGEYEIKKHKQICNEISVVLEGKCEFYTDDSMWIADKYSVHIIPKGKQHKIVVKRGEILRMFYIGFEFRDDYWSDFYALFSRSDRFIENINDDIKECCDILLKEVYAKQISMKEAIEAYIEILMVKLFRVLKNSEINIDMIAESERIKRMYGESVMNVIRYIDGNLENIYGVNQVAMALNYNRSYISSKFSKKMGMSIHQYIDRKKVEEAKKLLMKGMTVGDVAIRLGYSYPQSLWKLFMRCGEKTPTEFFVKKEN